MTDEDYRKMKRRLKLKLLKESQQEK